MPKVSFYLLPSASSQARYLFACKLIEKSYRSGQFCYVLTDSPEQSRLIDDLLWTFRAGSFIPHQIYTGELPDFDQMILIGSLSVPENWQKIVINLSANYPEYLFASSISRTERILEILDNNESTKELGRSRYRRYQQAGLEIETHKMEIG